MIDPASPVTRGGEASALPPISRWRAEFVNPDLEERFRGERSRQLRRSFLGVLGLILVMAAAVTPLDLQRLEGLILIATVTVRGVLLVVIVVAAVLAWRYPQQLLTVAPGLGLVVAVTTAALTLLYGPGFGGPVLNTMQFVLIGVMFLLVLPATGAWRIALAIALVLLTWPVALMSLGTAEDGEVFLSGLFVSGSVLAMVVMAHREDLLRRRQFAAIEALMSVSNTDSLTGVCNRRGFFETAEWLMRRARDSGEPLAAVLIDLDHFKSVNDRYGHAAGDEALVAAADRLREHADDAVVGRMGGEEFVILLPGETLAGAARRGEAVRQALEATTVETPAGAIRVTASLGVSTWQPDESLDSTLARADRAMYHAKSGGRNRVCTQVRQTAVSQEHNPLV
ncbi:MAG: GGDEF domain-containing protein [Thioalkalivibrio sp.]|nr:GGDEF domain-containing protein [Thioalkalivibrio sp.]